MLKNIARPSIKSMNDIRYKDPQKINKFLKGGIEINNLFQFCLKIQKKFIQL